MTVNVGPGSMLVTRRGKAKEAPEKNLVADQSRLRSFLFFTQPSPSTSTSLSFSSLFYSAHRQTPRSTQRRQALQITPLPRGQMMQSQTTPSSKSASLNGAAILPATTTQMAQPIGIEAMFQQIMSAVQKSVSWPQCL